MSVKTVSLVLLVCAEILGMSLWFSSSAVLTDMLSQSDISSIRQALLASGVQFGFAVGASLYAIFGVADRYEPRQVFALSVMGAALANALLLFSPLGGVVAILARIVTGALLAGVYPVGMRIAVSWGTKDRGFLVGLLVGALTLGSAAPHLLSFLGGTQWRFAVSGASILAFISGGLILLVKLGPHYAKAPNFSWDSLALAWRDRKIRATYLGYLGHMWELYAFWAWIGTALIVSFSTHMSSLEAISLAKLTAFFAVGIGAITCVLAGFAADRIGKAETTIIAMGGSGFAAVLAAAFFYSAPWILIIIVLFWGALVIADSAQFSALVADFAPPERAGSLLTFQTAIGFALTTLSVQTAPWVASHIGWRWLFVILALGPALGISAMRGLMRYHNQED